jgi:hypothetical protein
MSLVHTEGHSGVVDEMGTMAPRCLQRRAPFRYEIVDERGRRVAPTPAGYRLRPGREYRLRVEMQNHDAAGWTVQVIPPPRFVDWPATDAQEGAGRVLLFRTKVYYLEHWLHMLRTPVVELNVKINFADGRQPYEFSIPALLVERWKSAPIVLLGVVPGLLLPFELTWPWRWTVIGLGVAVATAICVVWDLRRASRRARELADQARQNLEQAHCAKGLA